MMSGYPQDAFLHRGPADVDATLVEKPFSPNLLLARVRMAIDAPRDSVESVPVASPPARSVA
jgi:hypothetical protein